MGERTREETETAFYQNAANRDEWQCFTEDQYWISRLEKAGATLVKTEPGGGRYYTLRGNQISLRKGAKRAPLSAERKQAAAERFAAYRAAKTAVAE